MKTIHTPQFANTVRQFANQVIGESSRYTERLSGGTTEFVYPRQTDNSKIIRKIMSKFRKNVAIKITSPSKNPSRTNCGWIRIYVRE